MEYAKIRCKRSESQAHATSQMPFWTPTNFKNMGGKYSAKVLFTRTFRV